ncbi:hypothetical protein SPRG_06651 [Saprolegnia parasitica CBS 223.65]|uniref:Uncharacterized protein n=1 Tax=Saprolegnia parasitica (strain CBS 223.65) TaxID=695850 RepID=A0A067CCC0_SAPPC|nr:hypothetical protein SPRG_06651 [Saprolegnia parasitica CBS 223.65]KDO28414.1 hypothetical protein SPRG_06651 [Saprolegnia parasitica CBS 223.65]|eukprot:XP_012200855.1 hypothetical protein SPRG_06651 [Saprolegnia parasitica CBS 223.65]
MERLQVYLSIVLDEAEVKKLLSTLALPRGSWYRLQTIDHLVDKTTHVLLSANAEASRFLCSRYQKGVQRILASRIVVVRAQKYVALPATSTVQRDTYLDHLDPFDDCSQHPAAQRNNNDDDALPNEMTPTIPLAYVMELLDILGDDVARVRDLFEAHARHQRVSLEGMTDILTSDGSHVALDLVLRLVSDMVQSRTVALQSPPFDLKAHVLGYTDVLSVYVVFHRQYFNR